jgi:uncharacterized membrane protein
MEASLTGPGGSAASRWGAPYPGRADGRAAYPFQAQRYKTYGAVREERIVRGLGWFSIGLGLAHLLAPRAMARATGMPDGRTGLMRAVGVRELATGVGILRQRQPVMWLWTRVAGDAMDLTILGLNAANPDARRDRVGVASLAVAGVAVLDLMTSMRQTGQTGAGSGMLAGLKQKAGALTGAAAEAAAGAVQVSKSLVINRPPEECYRFWRDFSSFPRFMAHIESVQVVSDRRTHWKAKGPAGMTVEWDAEIVDDQPGKLLSWRSVENADVDNAGTVRFEPAPGGRGTIVRVGLRYSPPGGKAGALIARLFGEEPSQQIGEDLRRFKWLIETGVIPTTVGQPSGPRGPITRLLFRKGAPG